jgi:hypothetical protein
VDDLHLLKSELLQESTTLGLRVFLQGSLFEDGNILGKEYYKLKLLQYKAMYELPEFVKLRQLMRAVVETNAWTQLEKDWKVITKNKYHQIVAKRQYVLF